MNFLKSTKNDDGLATVIFRSLNMPILIVFAITILELIAIFSNGAYFISGMTLCATGLWILVFIIAYKDWAYANFCVNKASRITIILMAALWIWGGLSIFWTLSPDLTWNEFNRTGAYVATFIIGIYAGAQHGTRRLSAFLFMIIASVAALYGLGVKIFPSVLDNYDNLARISVPIGYVNAQGLLVAMAMPLTLFFSTSKKENHILRLTSTICAPILLLCLFFTLSRGATLALLFGMIIFFILTPVRLRAFSMLVLVLIPTGLIAMWSNAQSTLMGNKVEKGLREATAAPLRLYLVLAILIIGLVFIVALVVGKRVRFQQKQKRLAGVALIFVVVAMLIMSSVLFLSSKPSFESWARDIYQDVRTTNSSGAGAERLLSVGASRRWQIWQEALSEWREHPLLGSGAQSFPIVHLLKRESGMPFVKQPHGLPFRLLSEQGIIGFALGGAFIVVTLIMTLLLLVRIDDRWKRGLAGTLFSVNAIYLVHTSFDWDWNILAVTMPYFLFTGMLVGWYGSLKEGAETRAPGTDDVPAPGPQEV